MLLMLMFFSICLLVLTRLDHPAVVGVRSWTSERLAPVLEAASVPAAAITRLRQRVALYMELFVELDRLKLENQKLKQYVWRVQMMEAEVERYRDLLKGVREPNLDFVTARVIADSSGVFVRSVLINAGATERVRDGHAVINGDGLVGRIVTSGGKVSRVLLLTDLNSRIPVMIGALGARGVLHGDNGPQPALEHLAADATVSAGDTVFTSGLDGVLPKGLKIGTVAVDGPRFVVEPYAGFEGLEYVSVLLFDGPGRTPAAALEPSAVEVPSQSSSQRLPESGPQAAPLDAPDRSASVGE